MSEQTDKPPVAPERIWIDSAGRIYPINPDNADFDFAPIPYVREDTRTRSPDGWDEAIAVVKAKSTRCGNCYHRVPANDDGSCSAYGYNGVDCQSQPCVCRKHDPTEIWAGAAEIIAALQAAAKARAAKENQ